MRQECSYCWKTGVITVEINPTNKTILCYCCFVLYIVK